MIAHKKNLVWAALAWSTFFNLSPAMAKETLGIFGEWGAFKNGPSCYAITASTSPSQGRKAPATLAISKWQNAGTPAQVMIGLGTTGSRLNLIVGTQGFSPTIRGNNAWMPDSKGDIVLIQSLLNSSTATATLTTQRGRRINDRFSLVGLGEAWKTAQSACP